MLKEATRNSAEIFSKVFIKEFLYVESKDLMQFLIRLLDVLSEKVTTIWYERFEVHFESSHLIHVWKAMFANMENVSKQYN